MNVKENKTFFSITEVALKIKIKPYIIRYWESKGLLIPIKLENGKRMYNQKHIDLMLKIKDLIYQKHISIKGVKDILKSKNDKMESFEQFEKIKKELKNILEILG